MRISDWSSDVCSSDLFESLASALGISLGTLLLGDDYADPSQPVRIDPATLAEALKLVDYDEDLGGEYEPQERARQVISAYEEIHAHGGTASHAYIGKVTLAAERSEEHTSELQSLMRISYAVSCLKKKNLSQ